MSKFIELFGEAALDGSIADTIQLINDLPKTTKKQWAQLLQDFADASGAPVDWSHFKLVEGEDTDKEPTETVETEPETEEEKEEEEEGEEETEE